MEVFLLVSADANPFYVELGKFICFSSMLSCEYNLFFSKAFSVIPPLMSLLFISNHFGPADWELYEPAFNPQRFIV
jgi:hypothetical protein